MAEFNLEQEYVNLIKVISTKNGITDEEVVETALAYFMRMYFHQMDMMTELERINKVFMKGAPDPEEIVRKIEEEQDAVQMAIAEAKRQGLMPE